MPARLLFSLLILMSFARSIKAETASAFVTTPVQLQRADKITTSLGLENPIHVSRVRDLIAAHYLALSQVHDTRDAALKAAKVSTAHAEVAANQARDTATARQADLHYRFLSQLAVELNPAQIELVKDGMTYGVVPLTYRVYQEMLPDLSADQKRQILAWLTEAREHAMGASTSEEKHAWFGKYKGRINNYLSAAGIDMKQAEKNMMDRKKAAAK